MEKLKVLNEALANFIFGEKFFKSPNIIKGLVSAVIVCMPFIPLVFFIFYLLPFLLDMFLPRSPKHGFHAEKIRLLTTAIWTLVFFLAIYMAYLYDLSKKTFLGK